MMKLMAKLVYLSFASSGKNARCLSIICSKCSFCCILRFINHINKGATVMKNVAIHLAIVLAFSKDTSIMLVLKNGMFLKIVTFCGWVLNPMEAILPICNVLAYILPLFLLWILLLSHVCRPLL